MPIIPTIMSSQMRARGTSLMLTGSKFSPIVSAASNAISMYLVSASVVTAVNQVTGPGAGTFTGKLSGLNAGAMANLMRAKATASLLTGRDIGKLFTAVSHGVVQATKTAIATGAVVGGGPGSGNGKVLGLVPTALESLIIAQLAGRILVGSKMRKLVSAIAFGICNHIMTAGRIKPTCVGAFAGPPAGPVQIPAAPGTGKIV